MKNIKQIITYICTFLIIMLMVLYFEWKGQNDVFFPEIATLAIGLFITNKQAWETSPQKLVCLTMLYSCLGAFVANIQLPIFILIPLTFFLCAYGLWRSQTSYTPLIAIAVLPILFQSGSMAYPMTTTTFAIIMVCVRYVLMKLKIVPAFTYEPVTFDAHQEIIIFGKRFLVVLVFSILAQMMNTPLLFAPPILMIFYEMSDHNPRLRDESLQLYILAIFMAFVGAYLRYFMCVQRQLSIVFVIALTTIILLLCLLQFEIFYPPIGAICLLPMIIDDSLLLLYPCFISVGMILSIAASYYVNYQKEEEDLLTDE